MATFTATGSDTLVINSRVFADLANADTVSITYPNDDIAMQTGKNGNTVFSQQAQGANVDMVVRLVKGSSDDQFLQSLQNQQNRDFASFALINGRFVKRMGDGTGNATEEVNELSGGTITRRVDTSENVEADLEQNVAVYNFKFATGLRTIS